MPVTIPVRGTALLLIDVVNDLAFPGSDALIEQAEPMAPRLAGVQAPRDGGRRPGGLRQRQLRPMALRLPADRGPLHRGDVAGPARVEADAADVA